MDPHNYKSKRHSPQGTPSIQDSISSCRHSYAVAEACKAGRPAHTWTAQHSKRTQVPKIVMHSWPHLKKTSGSPTFRASPMPATALLEAAMQPPAHADTILAI